MTPISTPGHFAECLAVAGALGGSIGLERQWHQGMAGLRTNALVAVGAAAFVSLPVILGEDGSGPAHIAAYIVSGIGFLGAGVILREGANVRGLNTAATLWATASVGAFAGSGLALQATSIAIAILSVNLLMRPLVAAVNNLSIRSGAGAPTIYRVVVTCGEANQAAIRERVVSDASAAGFGIRTVEMEPTAGTSGMVTISANLSYPGNRSKRIEEIVARLGVGPSIYSAGWSLTQPIGLDVTSHPGS